MANSQDTEITLGTGKMLALFFGLVALCAVFFAMGFKMGKGSDTTMAATGAATTTISTTNSPRASAAKSTAANTPPTATDVAFYKSAAPKAADATAAPVSNDGPDPAIAAPSNSYYVQVAAVSKQEDGDALVEALKKKQYPAQATTGIDKLYHIQVGPFTDIKSAEDMRAKLMNDGYNPILKK